MNRRFLVTLALLLAGGVAFAQFNNFRRSRGPLNLDDPRASQEGETTPRWEYPAGFQKDVFTFVRLIYSTAGRRRGSGGYGYGGRWRTDWPDADLNLSWRLQQMTSMKVDSNGICLEITDPDIFRYPFLYIVEPGDITFTDEEAAILRRHLLNGGFLMLDDFWGEGEWEGMAEAMEKVFPDRKWVDIPRTHPLFHCVFDIPNDLNLQCPNVGLGTESQYNGGVTWERYDAQEVHIRGIFDDKGRLCVIATHNTDNGDGWEQEGANQYYFKEFSEKKSYPLTINIIFYAMTH
jgi:hypothetical protein